MKSKRRAYSVAYIIVIVVNCCCYNAESFVLKRDVNKIKIRTFLDAEPKTANGEKIILNGDSSRDDGVTVEIIPTAVVDPTSKNIDNSNGGKHRNFKWPRRNKKHDNNQPRRRWNPFARFFKASLRSKQTTYHDQATNSSQTHNQTNKQFAKTLNASLHFFNETESSSKYYQHNNHNNSSTRAKNTVANGAYANNSIKNQQKLSNNFNAINVSNSTNVTKPITKSSSASSIPNPIPSYLNMIDRNLADALALLQSATLNASLPLTTATINNNIAANATSQSDKQQEKGKSSSSLKLSSKYKSKKANATQPKLDLAGFKETDVLTVQSLETILKANSYLKQPTTGSNDSKTASGSGKATKTVAFPQASITTRTTVQYSTMICGAFFGSILASSVITNLWLLGAIFGALYGYKITAVATNITSTNENPRNLGPVAKLVRACGRKLAKTYLQFYDACNTMFFMYKTGQLSYDYYKRYAELDQRFAIQNKIDRWNQLFSDGKVKFDQWEKENEIGRKTLAVVRTFWLVEERNAKRLSKRRRQSRYRLVQILYDSAYWAGKWTRSIWNTLIGRGSGELGEFFRGLQIDGSESRFGEVGSRLGAVLAAIIVVNFIGTLFSVAPAILSGGAILFAIIWPTWPSEMTDRINQYFSETMARGRGEDPPPRSSVVRSKKKDKNRYSYYIDLDGNKKYYRTGQPTIKDQRKKVVVEQKKVWWRWS